MGFRRGNYKVGIFGSPNRQELRSAQVSAATDGGDILTSDVQALGTVKVSVQLLGEKMVPSTLAVGLRIPRGNVKSWTNIDAKGDGQLQQVVTGRDEVISWNFVSLMALRIFLRKAATCRDTW